MAEEPVSDHRIIFRDKVGRILSWEEVLAAGGAATYEILGPESVPENAMALHQRGRQAGSEGNYQIAIELFEQASQIAPDWPYPIYDEAFSYLMLHDWDTAERLYARVDKMAPRGFFTAKPALDHLRRERQGVIPRGTYLSLVLIEFEVDLETRVRTVRSILKDSPSAPRGWQLLATLESDDDAKLHAIAQGLGYDPDPQTEGMLKIYKAQILIDRDHRKEAAEILNALSTDSRSPVDIELLSKLVLLSLLKK